MKDIKKIILCLLCAISLVGCQDAIEVEEKEETEESNEVVISDEFSDRDYEIEYIKDECSMISLSDGNSSGENILINDDVITINEAGTYFVSGTLSDGQLVVNVGNDEKVQIILDSVSITCEEGPCIYIEQADKVFLTMVEDSIIDINATIISSTSETNIDAAIYSQDDLTINGDGTLNVLSTNGNGITSKDTLCITSGTYDIQSDNHGLEGKDSLLIGGGTIDVTTAGGSANAPTITTSSNMQMPAGRSSSTSSSSSDDISAKGLKSDSYIYILDGDINIDAYDDAIHSDLDLCIDGGTIEISSGDDGIHGQVTTCINGGTITMTTCYEGLEGESVVVNGGDITMSCSDDGINAVSSSEGTGNACIEINGGSIYLSSINEGDGLDSNGDIYINGGYTVIESTDITTDTALDYDGEGTITGGVFIGLGSEGMTTQNFDENSTQGSILLTFNSTLCEDITICDEEGNILIEVVPTKEYQVVVVSSPDLVVGETYTLKFGTFTTEVVLDENIYGQGNHSSGTSGMTFQGGWR